MQVVLDRAPDVSKVNDPVVTYVDDLSDGNRVAPAGDHKGARHDPVRVCRRIDEGPRQARVGERTHTSARGGGLMTMAIDMIV